MPFAGVERVTSENSPSKVAASGSLLANFKPVRTLVFEDRPVADLSLCEKLHGKMPAPAHARCAHRCSFPRGAPLTSAARTRLPAETDTLPDRKTANAAAEC